MSSAEAPALTSQEISALVVLMAEGRELTNPQLNEFGVDLSGPARVKLAESLGLVASRRVGRSNAFTLTELGRETCLAWLAEQPPTKGAVSAALSVLLGALHRQGLTAATLFGDDELAAVAAQAATAPATVTPTFAAATPVFADLAPADVEARIRSAYRRLTTKPAAWVTLADIRDALAGVPRSDVDAALRRMSGQPGVRLIPVANLKSLEQRDKDAALRLGGENSHVLSIEAA